MEKESIRKNLTLQATVMLYDGNYCCTTATFDNVEAEKVETYARLFKEEVMVYGRQMVSYVQKEYPVEVEDV